MQHAIGSRPDPAHGYCTDDVARALQVDLLHAARAGLGGRRAERAAATCGSSSDAFEPADGPVPQLPRASTGPGSTARASEDSQGRAMLALGDAIATAPEARPWSSAAGDAVRAGPARRRRASTALRARSSVLLGCDAAMRGAPERTGPPSPIDTLADRLADDASSHAAGIGLAVAGAAA